MYITISQNTNHQLTSILFLLFPYILLLKNESQQKRGWKQCIWDNESVFCVKLYNVRDSNGYCSIIIHTKQCHFQNQLKFQTLYCFKIEIQHSVSNIPELVFHFKAVHFAFRNFIAHESFHNLFPKKHLTMIT